MERNDREYQRDYENRSDRNEAFDNYRDRYSNRHGNYYGMRDENAEYRNVRSANPDPNFGYRSGGPVGGYGASSYRGVTEQRGSDYHYGDPNPYMGNRRNEQSGGYERQRGTGWGAEDNYGTYGTARGTNYSAGSGSHDSDRYRRQDNSYRSGGQGRRYEDFNRDEKMYRGRSDRGYNMLGIDAYYDRGEHRERRSDNDYRGGQQRNYYDRDYDSDDMRYRGEISNSGQRDNYATGLYASNRSYVSDNDDYSQRSSRYRRPGETSGPDYRANSGASSYGMESPRG
ncbi:hypothetical protein [Pontibacter kalidii]|uniref:hypothetical protein n=1 Tax=Pontibacter kalidii TaxID=2592049 RepID=UPI00224F5A81|nr:hypothetical protein [Pontibacter kalidii]